MSLFSPSTKLKTLKHIAFLIGGNSASTKSELERRVTERLTKRDIPSEHARVLSVDMGIRNLAYCVVEASRQSVTSLDKIERLDLDVKVWKKLDLLQQLRPVDDCNTVKDGASTIETTESAVFSPESVSKLALSVSQQLLSHKPDVILIEQQRFRSSGGSAIQEWTVRVNMLESMLWACLHTLKTTSHVAESSFATIHGVNPAKVAKFWITGKTIALSPHPALLDKGGENTVESDTAVRSKITKKDKISVLQDWLNDKGSNKVSITFLDEAKVTAERFVLPAGSRRSKPHTDKVEKLDDLTDCLLQGAAWVKWEQNREKILQSLKAQCNSSDDLAAA